MPTKLKKTESKTKKKVTKKVEEKEWIHEKGGTNTPPTSVPEKPPVGNKKKAEEKELEFNVSEIIKWTDEECASKDKELHFSVASVRDIFKSLVAVNEKLSNTQENLNLLKLTLSRGLMTGYKITCPNCKREYVVDSMKLNRSSYVKCETCGTEYKENECISGVALIADKAIDNKIKDNETVII